MCGQLSFAKTGKGEQIQVTTWVNAVPGTFEVEVHVRAWVFEKLRVREGHSTVRFAHYLQVTTREQALAKARAEAIAKVEA